MQICVPDNISRVPKDLFRSSARGDLTRSPPLERCSSQSATEPLTAASRLNLGVSLARSGQAKAAEETFTHVADRWPAYFEGHLNLGKALAARGAHRDAARSFRRALSLNPSSIEALSGLGLSLAQAGRGHEALVFLRQAIRLDSSAAGVWSNLGLAAAVIGDYVAAESAFREALRLDPSLPEAHVNRGNTLKEQGRLSEAIACYDLAMLLNRDSGSARWNRSLALLQQGNFDSGWPEYESRWERHGQHRRCGGSAPHWDGSSPAGKTILIYSEQGLGDVVMFARYAALLKRAGATVIFESPFPISGILRSCPAIDRVVCEGEAIPPVDLVVPVMSLPSLCGTTLANVPAETPYLHPSAEQIRRCRERFRARGVPVVGLIWQGNPSHPWDRHRSIRLRQLLPLHSARRVHFVSLQRGPGREQLGEAGEAAAFIEDAIDDWPTEARAVEHLAAQIAAVDLLITVDTLPAHLAGAMGKPVWTLLSAMVDWRWMSDRTDSPWYPTMRLFRQRRRDDWPEVILRVREELESWLQRHDSRDEGRIDDRLH